MITVKSLGDPVAGAHWSMGAAHMQRIGRADAARLLAPYPVPRIGHETHARSKPGPHGFRHVLTVQNLGGLLFAASCTDTVQTWPGLLGVTVEPGRE